MDNGAVMKLRLVFASLMGLLLVETAAVAETGRLNGQAIKRVLSGKTLHLHTPIGVTLPIKYSGNGTMVGRAKPELAQYIGSRQDKGVWWVRSNRMCQKWKRWLEGKLACFTIRKRGRYVYWRSNDGQTGTGIISQ